MKADREQELMTRLSVLHRLSLNDAMDLLDVSESTARRLFTKLEQSGVVIRTHGGIQAVNNATTIYSFEHGARTNIAHKTAIGRAACGLLEDGDVVFCDSGTTIQCFCAQMVNYLRESKKSVKVYTNSLANLELLAPNMDVTLIGGAYRPNRKDFCGYLTEQALRGVYFDKCFVGTDGCQNFSQFTTTDFETARMNEIAMRNSECNIMLADSSKFQKGAHVAYAAVDAFDTIITDDCVKDSIRTFLNQCNAKIIYAKTAAENLPFESTLSHNET